MYVFLEPAEKDVGAFKNRADNIYFQYAGVWGVCTNCTQAVFIFNHGAARRTPHLCGCKVKSITAVSNRVLSDLRFHVRARRCVDGGRRAHVSQVAQVCPSSAASRQRENRAHVTEPARARGTWVCYLERTVGTTRERRGSAPSHSSSLPSSHWLLLLISSLPSKSSASLEQIS